MSKLFYCMGLLSILMCASVNVQAQIGPFTGTANINLGGNQISSPTSIITVPVNIDITGMSAFDSVQNTVPLVLGSYRFAIQYDNTLIQPQLNGGNISGGTTFEFAIPVNANAVTSTSNLETLIIYASQPNNSLPSGNLHVADIPFVVKTNAGGVVANISIITMDLRTPISSILMEPLSIMGGVTIPNNINNIQIQIAFYNTDIDSDTDGLPDAWERAQFGSLTRDGSDDFDFNGIDDLTEFQIYNTYMRDGDATGDSILNIADYLLLQRHAFGYIVLPDSQKARLDVYPEYAPDGLLNIQDMIILSRMLFKLVPD